MQLWFFPLSRSLTLLFMENYDFSIYRAALNLLRLLTKDYVEISLEAEKIITPEIIPQRINRYNPH